MSKDGAPGKLETLRQFVNTFDPEDGSDELSSAIVVSDWLRRNGLEPHAALNDADLAELKRFRESLRDICLANNGEGDPHAAWRELAIFASRAKIGLEVDPTAGRLILSPCCEGVAEPITAIFSIIYDAVAAGTWSRLKACRKRNCLFAFYDHSKNGSGIWCSMAVCGNRVKAQRRRSRASS